MDYCFFGDLPKIKILLDFVFNTGPYEAGNFKTLLQFSSDVSQTL